jgi:hypothetical protein
MRKDSVQRVKDALDLSAGPLSLVDLRKSTGLSPNTLTMALSELGAKKLTDHYPFRWIKGTGQVDNTMSTVGLADGDQMLVDRLTYDNPVERWETGRMKFGNNVLGLRIDKDSDPVKLAEQFASGAAVLASISLALQNVKKDPDWYEKLVH